MDRREFILLPTLVGLGVSVQDPRQNPAARAEAQALLRGLTRVGVSVHLFGEIVDWVDIGRLQTRAELALRQFGVPVISGNIAPEPTLMIMVYSLQIPATVMLALSAEIIEPVLTVRLPQARRLGRTWGGNPLLTDTTRSTAVNDIQDSLSDLCELFANDWLAANRR